MNGIDEELILLQFSNLSFRLYEKDNRDNKIYKSARSRITSELYKSIRDDTILRVIK